MRDLILQLSKSSIYSTKPVFSWRVGDIERLNHSRLWVVSQNAEFPFANSSLTFAIPTYLKNKNLLRILLFNQPL
ncbi:hypothetical protein EJ501_27645 [Klebsiella pneumoniae subsp. pneumoniae]|nr:hypothetical protein EJ501_27645 [Klebsiella pneumoniae subsp. pneumoniae]